MQEEARRRQTLICCEITKDHKYFQPIHDSLSNTTMDLNMNNRTKGDKSTEIWMEALIAHTDHVAASMTPEGIIHIARAVSFGTTRFASS